jgi:hypothetical protein
MGGPDEQRFPAVQDDLDGVEVMLRNVFRDALSGL